MSEGEILFLDLETADAGPDMQLDQYGISIVTVMDQAGDPAFYTDGDLGDYSLEALAKRIRGADEVVTYNGANFDIPVIEATLRSPVPVLKHTDLYQEIDETLKSMGVRRTYGKGAWTLDRVCRDTIGEGKLLDDGIYAPMKWREQRYGEVVTYNFYDVKITRKLWLFIQEHGYVLDPFGRKIDIQLD